jgi:multiple antibiotic resistance protein
MTREDFLVGLVTLLVTIDPVGLIPVFLSLTRGLDRAARGAIALRAACVAFLILSFFVLAGDWLLRWLAISLAAFRISGGLLLFWIAFEMVFEKRAEREQQTADVAMGRDRIRDVAAVPLAIPLMAGPGAITAVILLASRGDGGVMSFASLLGLIAIVTLVCYIVFLAAARLAHLLGATGQHVLSRMLGLLLSALAVQFVVDGLRALLSAPPTAT